MSEAAKTLLHYASHAREADPHQGDRAYCASRAREWAAFIISNGVA